MLHMLRVIREWACGDYLAGREAGRPHLPRGREKKARPRVSKATEGQMVRMWKKGEGLRQARPLLPGVLRDNAPMRAIPHPQKGRLLYLGKLRTRIRYLLLLNR